MITLIHGPAELIRAESAAEIVARIATDPEFAALNTTRLEGRTTTLAEVQNACDTLPFLVERRLVIVEGLLARLAGSQKSKAKAEDLAPGEAEAAAVPADAVKGLTKAFLGYFEHAPESVELVLLEDGVASGASLRRLQELAREGKARIVTCEKPRKSELPDWIRSRARMRNVKLDAEAVADLTDFVGDELRQVDQELIKLADYAGGRTVTREDVRRLVPGTRAANVFEMVDALGMGDRVTAGRVLQHALDVDGEQPLRLIGMIARQFRLLIQCKALQAEGVKTPDIGRALNVADWTAPKLVTQANRHTFARLERAMERILAADEAIKTGKLSDRDAMDVLLAELIEGI